jgi:nucleotide-binding universal stress UspA family protein
VAIAWKTGAEAARAVSATMPIIAAAKSVHVLGAGETPQEEADCRDDLETIARQLRLYGIQASGLAVTASRRKSCDSILSAAEKLGADLVVMGAYGHSRVRELVLGGFTEQVLDGVPLPVLLFH